MCVLFSCLYIHVHNCLVSLSLSVPTNVFFRMCTDKALMLTDYNKFGGVVSASPTGANTINPVVTEVG